MFLNKIQFAAVVLLVFGLVGSGAGLLAHRTAAEQPRAVAPAAPADAADKVKAENPKDKAKPKADADAVFAVAVPDRAARLKTWRDKLAMPVDFPGVDQITFTEALKDLGERYQLSFHINMTAFEEENLTRDTPLNGPVPAMKANLATVLKAVLARVPSESKATYLLRNGYVEITTCDWVDVIEMGRPEPIGAPILPPNLVWDAFEGAPIAEVLQRIAEANDLNLVTDPRVAKQLQTKATAQFNNVPVDTALRLLLNMADVSMVRMDNVYYLTTAENAKHLLEEHARLDPQRTGN